MMIRFREQYKPGEHVLVLRYLNQEGVNKKLENTIVMRIHAVGKTDQGNEILMGHRVSRKQSDRMWLYTEDCEKIDYLTASRLAFPGEPSMRIIYDAFNAGV